MFVYALFHFLDYSLLSNIQKNDAPQQITKITGSWIIADLFE